MLTLVGRLVTEKFWNHCKTFFATILTLQYEGQWDFIACEFRLNGPTFQPAAMCPWTKLPWHSTRKELPNMIVGLQSGHWKTMEFRLAIIDLPYMLLISRFSKINGSPVNKKTLIRITAWSIVLMFIKGKSLWSEKVLWLVFSFSF